MTTTERYNTLIEKIPAVFEAGKAQGGGGDGFYDLFWDTYQNGKGYNFYGKAWTDDIFLPKHDIVKNVDNGNGAELFRDNAMTSLKGKLEVLGKRLDVSACTSFVQMFMWSTIKDVPTIDGTNCENMNGMFGYSSVETIDKLILSEKLNVVNNAFQNAKFLTRVIFAGVIAVTGLNLQWSELDVDSLRSLLICLADKSTDTSGTTWKVTVGSANLATIEANLETEALQAQKKGWVID